MNAQTLILGGGPAGAAAAILLARAGHAVLLAERDTTPKHKVCGEFLSAEALHLLTHLGLNLNSPKDASTPEPAPRSPTASAPGTWVSCAQQHWLKDTGPGIPEVQPIRTVRLASTRHLTEAQLPFPAQSLTRRCLDTLLLQAAKNAGATIVRGSIEQLTQTPAGWQGTLGNGQALNAARAILATGKHDLRGFPRPPGGQNDLVALKMYWQLAPAQARVIQETVELHLFPHGYFGLQPVEDGTANFTALVHRKHLSQLGGWRGLLREIKATNPHAADRLFGATELLDKPLALSGIPYGFVRRQALAPTLYAVGDQAAVIPSFTGDGMSIALYTGLAAAHAVLIHQPATLFQPQLHGQLRRQISRATLLSRALIHPVFGPMLTAAAHLWPGGLAAAASLTRLSERALQSLTYEEPLSRSPQLLHGL